MNEAIRYAVIDTEGSGLFDFSKSADAEGQPRLASLCMILLKADLAVEEVYHAYVKPVGWVVDPASQASRVHKLTQEFLEANGKPVVEVLAVYQQAIREGFAIAAFNVQHDLKSLRAELRRSGLDDMFLQTKNVCLMRRSQGFIPRPDEKKSWPKLEHCRKYLKLSDDGAHTALADAHAALEILRYLHRSRVDLTPEVHFAKNRPTDAGPERVQSATVASNDAAVSNAPISRPKGAPAVPIADQEIPT